MAERLGMIGFAFASISATMSDGWTIWVKFAFAYPSNFRAASRSYPAAVCTLQSVCFPSSVSFSCVPFRNHVMTRRTCSTMQLKHYCMFVHGQTGRAGFTRHAMGDKTKKSSSIYRLKSRDVSLRGGTSVLLVKMYRSPHDDTIIKVAVQNFLVAEISRLVFVVACRHEIVAVVSKPESDGLSPWRALTSVSYANHE
ncbi:hypothetical protein BD410DRAFT_499402 [Rickenella mellea]|uniref:Uncharacterized protein n=1 Tax=Rickenella mellea TaxID=50990 RepID=A0A4Y7PTK6_9AGAM|nr:hypothetical protein BD410DRAFT_499402 [Rickenella mellea]